MKFWISVLTLVLFVTSALLAADLTSAPSNSEVSDDIFFMDRQETWIAGSASRAPTSRSRRVLAVTVSLCASPSFCAPAGLDNRIGGLLSAARLQDKRLFHEVLRL